MVNIKNHIKNHDLFGYRVDLNFNKRGHSHQTIIGGFISLLLKGLIILYVWYLYSKMVGYKENYIDIFEQAQDYDKLGAVKYTDMNLNILPVLMDSMTLRPIDFDEETRSYISINYNIESYDISGNNYESYQHPQEEIIEARKCVM